MPTSFHRIRPALRLALVKEHPLRARASRRTGPASLSLRKALLVLALVPGIALAALWAVTSGQTLLDFQRQAAQGQLAEKAGQPSNIVYYNLQEERRLSAEALAGRNGAGTELTKQRKLTDRAVTAFKEASDVSEDDAPDEVLDAVTDARSAISQLGTQRALVDEGDAEQQKAVYDYYTDLIAVDLRLFTALSHVDNGRITTLSQPLVDLFWAKELMSRSDALLARGWGERRLSSAELGQVREAVAGQPFQQQNKVVPFLPADEQAMWKQITAGKAWKAKTRVETALLRPAAADGQGYVRLPAQEDTWRSAMDEVTPELRELLEHRTALVVDEGKGSVMSLLRKTLITSVVGLLAVIAVIWTTWRLTRNLRNRIGRLHQQAEELEKALPEVVDRLGRGERIDVEAEARAIRQSEGERVDDELTRLGDALNLARTSALEAAVRQADQHRGFERLLQRIARRTQQLIGQQLKKLDQLERRHEDPEVLDGLFDLDHLTARLRRYEENLVILAGGAPHRRWRKPVALLDVLRSAQGEVQDYRRVMLDLDGSPWLAARAVGPVTHVLAELIENALRFSRPPSPVEVRAAMVARGLAIEVEDRGLGMEEDQLAEANALMGSPPRMDLLARAEDVRLGLQVIARLASQYGLRVEFRTSAYGGTRVVVLVPLELTVQERESGPVAVPERTGAPDPDPVRPVAEQPSPAGGRAYDPADPHHPQDPYALPEPQGALPVRGRGRALAGVTAFGTPASSGERIAPDAAAADGSPNAGAPEAPYGAGQFGDGNGVGLYDAGVGAGDGAAYGAPPAAPEAGASAADPQRTAGHLPPEVPHPAHETQHGAAAEGPLPDGSPFPVPSHPTSQERYVTAHQPYSGHTPPVEPGPAHAEPALPPVPGQAVPHTVDAAAGLPPAGGEPPLPRRVRQASLVDELRVAPPAETTPRPPRWDDDPVLRPAPRRAGATIGAFQRRSRAARATGESSREVPAPSPSPDPHNPTREDRS